MIYIVKSNSKIIYVLLLLFIFLNIRYKLDSEKRKYSDDNYSKIEEFEKSISKSFFSTLFIENEISKIRKFIKYNEKDQLADKINLLSIKKNQIPEITVIMTIYNQEECLNKCLRSIQNQSFKNIEIIVVDDYSLDNSVKKIEEYQKEDNRIILLKHPNNYGTIKSRTDAINLAKGKYITIIDGDDSLAQKDILYNCLIIANLGNLDVVEFKLISSYNFIFKGNEVNEGKIKNINNRIIYQPELKYIFIKINQLWSLKNRNICQKFIKNEIFKKIIEYIGPKYTEDFIIEFEDTIMAFSLFFIAKSYYLMKNIGYYRAKCKCKNCKSIKKIVIPNNKLDSMKYINFLTEKLDNNKYNSQFIYYELLSVVHYHHNFEEKRNIDFKYIYNILDTILKKFTFYNKNQKDTLIHLKERLFEKDK